MLQDIESSLNVQQLASEHGVNSPVSLREADRSLQPLEMQPVEVGQLAKSPAMCNGHKVDGHRETKKAVRTRSKGQVAQNLRLMPS